MIAILGSVLLFSAFLISNFKMFFAYQAKENVYSEDMNLLSDISLNLKELEHSLMESKLSLANLMAVDSEESKALLKNYLAEKAKLDPDIIRINAKPNEDSIQSEWFSNAKKANGRIAFTLPYHDSLSDRTLMDFSTNIYNSKGQDIGVVSHSFLLDKLTRELLKCKKSSNHDIYLIDYRGNLITSTSLGDTENMQVLDMDRIGLGKYKDKIFSHSNLYSADSEYYIFFTPIFENNFVLISVVPITDFYTTKNFFMNTSFVVPILIFLVVMMSISIFVVVLMSMEQRKKEIIEMESFTDVLTGIYNRRFFEKNIEIVFAKANQENEAISLIMMDIDFFKKCNDTYGHTQGDEVLRVVADIFAKYARRKNDFVSRLGGEEFGMVLSNADRKSTINIAEQIRKEIEATKIKIINSNEHISVTASFGIAHFAPRSEQSPRDLYDIADKMLYEAKYTGRNKVCCA